MVDLLENVDVVLNVLQRGVIRKAFKNPQDLFLRGTHDLILAPLLDIGTGYECRRWITPKGRNLNSLVL